MKRKAGPDTRARKTPSHLSFKIASDLEPFRLLNARRSTIIANHSETGVSWDASSDCRWLNWIELNFIFRKNEMRSWALVQTMFWKIYRLLGTAASLTRLFDPWGLKNISKVDLKSLEFLKFLFLPEKLLKPQWRCLIKESADCSFHGWQKIIPNELSSLSQRLPEWKWLEQFSFSKRPSVIRLPPFTFSKIKSNFAS